ncbi:NAD(P)H-binding protein [Rugosimonospora acidiphila]|uniref:NAD(P)H-binding protein n=1 Tax=Rugosimonospora acidiphila TaxID=556531 RepID=A0ABP9RLD7_9ACTN
MTILVTGARGTVSAGLLRHLAGTGADVRIASSAPRPDQSLLDLHDPATFSAALEGVSQVFLYTNAATAADFACAAAAAGVRHVVLLSSNAVTTVADPDVNPMAAPFSAAETALSAGPVPVTVLRPGSFASNARQWVYGIRAERAVDLPYPDARVDAVDEADVAEVAYRALTDPGLWGATLDLTGPDAVSLVEQIRILAAVLGEEIGVNRVTREQWKRSVNRYMTSEYADALLDYWRALEIHPAPVSTAVATVTGRPATGFRTWVERNVGMFR